MSTTTPPASALPGAADPSMDDILASIRRILSEDEAALAGGGLAQTSTHGEGDVLMLDQSMLIGAPAQPEPEPALSGPAQAGVEQPGLLSSESEAAAAGSVGTLLRTLTEARSTEVHRGGPTIEDLVRECIRPLLKSWMDVHLPPLVERAVRTEIERITGRAGV